MKLIDIDPPNYLFGFIIAVVALHFLTPSLKFIYYPYTIVGIIPLGIGIYLNLAADSMLKKKVTTVKPLLESKTLVTSGIFGKTRNPMYLGFILILSGISILLGSLIPFMITLFLAVFLRIVFVRFEEQKLEKNFGVEWMKYKNNVRRWI